MIASTPQLLRHDVSAQLLRIRRQRQLLSARMDKINQYVMSNEGSAINVEYINELRVLSRSARAVAAHERELLAIQQQLTNQSLAGTSESTPA